MPLSNLAPWLLANPGFKKRLEDLTTDMVCAELGPGLERIESLRQVKHDWRYLLLSASILCASADGACQAAALRIAHGCLSMEGAREDRKNAAALILDSLANLPAIDLAISRRLLSPHFEKRLPNPARIEWMRRLIENSVVLRNDSFLPVNRFQRRFWEMMDAHEKVSVSAPTSAGKSFIMSRWISEFIGEHPRATIVYLVPTRALISEVNRHLTTVFVQSGVSSVAVSIMPIQKSIVPDHANVLVFTQERLHLLLTIVPELSVDLLIVDEAHKVGDRQRGVLLQQVVEQAVRGNPHATVVFASPMTSNPEVLITDFEPGERTAAFTSDDVTVNQNLIWISQVARQPLRWRASLCLHDDVLDLGHITLKNSPAPETKRLPFLAHAIGGAQPGNIIYVNGAAAAEKCATQLFDLLDSTADTFDAELDELIDLATKIVHPDFLLPKVLRRGIAFHYGNMPLMIREEVERLFSLGIIKYLICTSTLIEGVNMACRNIFLRGPKKGASPMSAEDFWNLAGRAGRWGKEFQGNIVCVDSTRSDVWGADGPPKNRLRAKIVRTTDLMLSDPSTLIKFIDLKAPHETSKNLPGIDYVFSYLMADYLRTGSLNNSVWASRYGTDELLALDGALDRAAKIVRTPQRIIERNPGINPFAMDALLAQFEERSAKVEQLLPTPPESDDAVDTYTRIFGLLSKAAVPKLGPEGPRTFFLALLVTRWMRGFPLARLIVDRLERSKRTMSTAKIIRAVMEDVEQIARFEAPKGLNCYSDVLQFYLRSSGRADLIGQIPDLTLLLEFGVSQQTQLSLIGYGLSRTSAIALSEIIAADNLTESNIREWLEKNDKLWRDSDLPSLVKREISLVIVSQMQRSGGSS